ncbi:MAG: inositol monophosphatase family protein [Hyphomonadaceae bacterium]
MQSAASDLSLLEDAARQAQVLVRKLLAQKLDVRSKGAAGPVTNIDLAVDALLTEKLRSARPDYGWLSEETPDDAKARLGKSRVFMLDPIDGTAAMIAGAPQFTICIGVIENERAFAGVILNPMTDELYLGAPGLGATLNGAPINASPRNTLEGARVSGKPGFYTQRWPQSWPKMEFTEQQSIAYRMAKVAEGDRDFTILFGAKNEWDIAAGAAIVEAAGGRFTDPWGSPVAFNQPIPRAPGGVAAGAAIHPLVIERTKHFRDPR